MEHLHTGHNRDIAPSLGSNPKVKTQVKTVVVGGVGCWTGRGWCGGVHARSSDPANINRLAGSEGALKHHAHLPLRVPRASQKSRSTSRSTSTSTSRSTSTSTSKSKPCRSGRRPAADLFGLTRIFGLTRSRSAALPKRSGLGCHKAQSILIPGATRRYLVALWHPGTERSGRVAHKARMPIELVAHKARMPIELVAHKGARSSWLCGTWDGFERGAEGMARVVTADGVGK
jgi:hypothetical protein